MYLRHLFTFKKLWSFPKARIRIRHFSKSLWSNFFNPFSFFPDVQPHKVQICLSVGNSPPRVNILLYYGRKTHKFAWLANIFSIFPKVWQLRWPRDSFLPAKLNQGKKVYCREGCEGLRHALLEHKLNAIQYCLKRPFNNLFRQIRKKRFSESWSWSMDFCHIWSQQYLIPLLYCVLLVPVSKWEEKYRD
jgi:hypothetical protein